ncbi:MAG TPA: 6-hydroxymethylpterin diphosphokinase MptE-like protein [Rectinemataceae bacterium]|nr:6-hydroxymethylpterin diphosphokinase MptE-like protein [Rectinemataceae bacterium]
MSLIILIGPCLDFLSECIAERNPSAEVLSIQLSPGFRGHERGGAGARWYPDLDLSLENFILETIDQDALAPIAMLEWPPGVAAFPEEADRARKAVSACIARLASDAATIRAMGRRWISNSIRNFLDAERLVSLDLGKRPLAVLGAGPSLAGALDLLSPVIEAFSIVTVSSAAAAVLGRGIRPDLVVSTDPGWWSLSHLRAIAEGSIPLAMPLSACAAWRRSPLLILDQGWGFESELSGFLGKALRLPSHGTVSGSALAVAASLGEGPIVVAGFDFAVTGSESHARPHAFDPFILASESRLEPGDTLRWNRLSTQHPDRLGESGWRSSRPLAIYADAIASDARRLEGRVSRLRSSPVLLDGVPEIGVEALLALARRSPEKGNRVFATAPPPQELRRAWLVSRMRAWRRAARAFTDSGVPGALPEAHIADILRCVDLPDWAAMRRALRDGRDITASRKRLAEEVEDFFDDLERKWVA